MHLGRPMSFKQLLQVHASAVPSCANTDTPCHLILVSETMFCVFHILVLKLQDINLKYVLLFYIVQWQTMTSLEISLCLAFYSVPLN